MTNPGVFKLIASDYHEDPRNWKGLLLLCLYRLAHSHLSAPRLLKPITFLYLIFYKAFSEIILGTEIHWRCEIGERARISHGYGLVIHSDAIIGKNVLLRHGVTIGMKRVNGVIHAPVIGNNVNIGASALIIGDVSIGDNSEIGAGSVVVKDIPENSIVAGNPARIIGQVAPTDI